MFFVALLLALFALLEEGHAQLNVHDACSFPACVLPAGLFALLPESKIGNASIRGVGTNSNASPGGISQLLWGSNVQVQGVLSLARVQIAFKDVPSLQQLVPDVLLDAVANDSRNELILNNVAFSMSCEALGILKRQICSSAAQAVPRTVQLTLESVLLSSFSLAGGRVRGANIEITCDGGADFPTSAGGLASLAGPCSLYWASTGDALWSALEQVQADALTYPSNTLTAGITSRILIPAHVTLAGPKLDAYAQFRARTGAQLQPITFTRDVVLQGVGGAWQLDFGGSASLGLFGLGQMYGSLQLLNLTLSSLPAGVVRSPFGLYPWSLSSMFMWAVLLPRAPGNSSRSDALLISNCTIIVPDDELTYWSTLSPDSAGGDTSPLAVYINSHPYLMNSFLARNYAVAAVGGGITSNRTDDASSTENEPATANGGAGSNASTGTGGVELHVWYLQGLTPSWTLSDVVVVGPEARRAQGVRYPQLTLRTGLLELSTTPGLLPSAVHLGAWGQLSGPDLLPLSSVFPTQSQVDSGSFSSNVALLGGLVAIDPLSILGVSPGGPAAENLVLLGDPLDPDSCVLDMGGEAGVMMRMGSSGPAPKPPPSPSPRLMPPRPPARRQPAGNNQGQGGGGRPFNGRRLQAHLNHHQQQARRQPGVAAAHAGPRQLPSATAGLWRGGVQRRRLMQLTPGNSAPLSAVGAVPIAPGSEMSLRYLTLINLPANPVTLKQQPTDEPVATAAGMFGNLTANLWLFQLDRDGGEGPAGGTLELINTTIYIPPDELQLYVSILTRIEIPLGLGPPARTMQALRELLDPMRETAQLPRPERGGRGPAVTFPVFSWRGMYGYNVTFASLAGGSPVPDGWPSFPSLIIAAPVYEAPDAPVLPPPSPGAQRVPPGAGKGAADGDGDGVAARILGLAVGLSVGVSVLLTALVALLAVSRVRRRRAAARAAGKADEARNGHTQGSGMAATPATAQTPTTQASGLPASSTVQSGSTSYGQGAPTTEESATGARGANGNEGHAGTSQDSENATKALLAHIFSGVGEGESLPAGGHLDSKEWKDSWDVGGGQNAEQQPAQDPRAEMSEAVERMRLAAGGHVSEESQVQVHSMLGRGAFGVAYRGTWRGLEVAVKRILFQLMPGPQGDVSRRKALREAAINATLSHPAIVATYSYDMVPLVSRSSAEVRTAGVRDWELYIIMEYCDQGSLSSLLTQRRLWDASGNPINMEHVLALALQLASGMAYLHTRNILHGDLKPDNVLLRSDPNSPFGMAAKVGDFGMSIKMAANQTHVSGVHHGTPLYVAPEILHAAQAAKAADVYSYGVLLWELGHGRTAWEQLLRVTQDRPVGRGMAYVPGLYTFSQDYPVPLYAQLTEACLSLKPPDRPDFNTISQKLRVLMDQLRAGQTAGRGQPEAGSLSADQAAGASLEMVHVQPIAGPMPDSTDISVPAAEKLVAE